MRKIRLTAAVTCALLAIAVLVKLLTPGPTGPVPVSAVEPVEIELTGLVHDFSRRHPDFGVAPASGYGHYAGSIASWLPGQRRPRFAGGGYKVTEQWVDRHDRPIAPHMAGVRGGLSRETLGLRVSGSIELKKEASIDAYNSNYGPYGIDGNFGRDAVLSTNAIAPRSVRIERHAFVRGDVLVGPEGIPAQVIDAQGFITGDRGRLDEAYEMPDPSLPEHLEAYQPRLDLSGVVTLTGDVTPDDEEDDPAVHVGDLHVRKDAVVTVEGDLVIRCDRSLSIDKARIVLQPEATLTFYVSAIAGGSGDVKIKDQSLVNVDPGDTTLVTINALGPGKLEIAKKSHVCATIVAPDRRLTVKDEAHFYGGYVGESVKVEKKGSQLHVDLGNATAGHANFALSVREKVKVEGDSFIDSFDSNEGPYGGDNVGRKAWVSTNAIKKKEKVEVKDRSQIRGDVMIGPFGDLDKVIKIESRDAITGSIGRLGTPYAIPIVTPPAMGSSIGDVEHDGGTHVIESDLHCKKLKLDHGATVTIRGDVTIRIDDKLELKDGSEILLDPGARLTLYVKKEVKVEEHSAINANTGNPQLVSIRMMSLGGKGKLRIKKTSRVCAWTQGAKAELKIEDHSQYFGSFTGKKVEVKGNSRFHVDMAYLASCIEVLDTAGEAGPDDDGAITSEATFAQWFRTVMGVNQSVGHPITLTRNGAGVFSYLDNRFHPLDDRLLGNEGETHNNHFTYTISAGFEFDECAGQFVEFEGGDGFWLFIDDQLVLDLGGVRAPKGQIIELDRLGLEDGKTYVLRLFYAQRQSLESVFRLRTNLELNSDRFAPPVSAQFD